MSFDRFFYPQGSLFGMPPAFDWKLSIIQALGINLVLTISKAALIIILAIVINKVGIKIIKKTFEKQKMLNVVNPSRLDTLCSLFSSILKYMVYFLATMFFLQFVFGFNASATIAAISVSGVAVGLAAQGIIKDIITGIFILMENQFAVGEMVTIKDKTGIIEEMELRVTRLRGEDGDLHVIPNGEVGTITNHSRKVEKSEAEGKVSSQEGS